MTGQDVLNTMLTVATMNTGSGFSACFDLNCWPEYLHGSPTKDKALQLAGNEIQRRMHETNVSFEKLIRICLTTGTVWKSDRGWAVERMQQLTTEEEQALLEVRSCLTQVDTFISNPVYNEL